MTVLVQYYLQEIRITFTKGLAEIFTWTQSCTFVVSSNNEYDYVMRRGRIRKVAYLFRNMRDAIRKTFVGWDNRK